jgi:hypothetical protein
MPKVNNTHYYVTEFPYIFKIDGGVLFCIYSGIEVPCNSKSQVAQYLLTSKRKI